VPYADLKVRCSCERPRGSVSCVGGILGREAQPPAREKRLGRGAYRSPGLLQGLKRGSEDKTRLGEVEHAVPRKDAGRRANCCSLVSD
jgi:hypothetical protein